MPALLGPTLDIALVITTAPKRLNHASTIWSVEEMLHDTQCAFHPLQPSVTTSMPPSSINQVSPRSSTTESPIPRSSTPAASKDAPKPSKANNKKSSHPAATSAKREVVSQTLTTWTYPPSPTNPLPPNRLTPTTHWVERADDSSPCPSPSFKPISHPPPTDPYKYDTPDSLSLAIPAVSRKRKRRKALLEEIAWNPGLRTFVERRDLWTGALPPSPYQTDGSTPLLDATTTSSHTYPLDAAIPLVLPPPPLLPLAPPLLPPTNSIRASISPATYPAIYSKVVVQGLSPTVPINLKDVVRAIVGGWKADGEWPPKGDDEGKGINGRGGGEGKGAGGGKVRRGVRRLLGGLGVVGELDK